MKGSKRLTIVIKLGVLVAFPLPSLKSSCSSGTSSIVDEKTHEPILSILTLIVETAVKLRKHGHRVVIVSSGAIGVGLRRMDIEKRPKHLPQVQVCIFTTLDLLRHLTVLRHWRQSVNAVLSPFGTLSLLIFVNRLLKFS